MIKLYLSDRKALGQSRTHVVTSIVVATGAAAIEDFYCCDYCYWSMNLTRG